ncbi:MAG: PhoH family protein [Bacteroidota bacterium]
MQSVDLVNLYGPNDKKWNHLKEHFPKLKIIARGGEIRVIGEDPEVARFEEKFSQIISYLNRYNRLSTSIIDSIINTDARVQQEVLTKDDDEVLVYGNQGIQVKAVTQNQKRIVEAHRKNDMVFAIGPAGTGKTYTAVALAVRALKNKEVKRLILTRPAVEAGEHLGFLPGDLKEKLDPYMQPLYDALRDMIPPERLEEFIETGVIQIAPLAFMRGRTLDKSFVILDEAQNATTAQLKMFLTRMGRDAKFVITGDLSQIDLPKKQQSGLPKAVKMLDNVEGISIVQLENKDIIRHPLVEKILMAYDQAEAEYVAHPKAPGEE